MGKNRGHRGHFKERTSVSVPLLRPETVPPIFLNVQKIGGRIGGAKSKIIKARNSEKMLIRINVNLGKEKILGGLGEVGIMRIIFNFLSAFCPFCPRSVPPIFFLLPPIIFSTIGPFFDVPENQNGPYKIKAETPVFGAVFDSSEADFLHDRLPLFTIGQRRRGEDGEFEGRGEGRRVYEITGRGAGAGQFSPSAWPSGGILEVLEAGGGHFSRSAGRSVGRFGGEARIRN